MKRATIAYILTMALMLGAFHGIVHAQTVPDGQQYFLQVSQIELLTEDPEVEPAPSAHPLLDGKTPEELLATLASESVVTYNAYGAQEHSKNLIFIRDFIEAFQQAEDARLWLELDGLGFPGSIYLFETKGKGNYTVYRYTEDRGWISATSSLIVQRYDDYVFLADIDPAEWYRDWQTMVVRTQIAEVEANNFYDPSVGGSIGSSSPKEAVDALHRRMLQQRYHAYANGIGSSSFAGGSYFPLNLVVPEEEIYPIDDTLQGAVSIYGEPYYLIGMGDGSTYAVRADGADRIYSISLVDGNYTLMADAAQQEWEPVMIRDEPIACYG